MKNPQKYKQFYKAWNDLKAEIILNITQLLIQTKTHSIDLREAVSQCVIKEFGLGQESLAMGVVLEDDHKRITIYYGHKFGKNTWDPIHDMDVEHLDTRQLLRIYNVIEESFYDWEAPPFKK